METTVREHHPAIIDKLIAEPEHFDFYQAVSLIERANPEHVGVVEPGPLLYRLLNFRSKSGLSFPASDVIEVQQGLVNGQPRYNMLVTFMSLAGAFGPLPYSITEKLIDQRGEQNYSLDDFLNIFNHRMISLLYYAKKKRSVYFDVRKPEENFLATQLFSLTGLRREEARVQIPMPRRTFLKLNDVMLHRFPTADGLSDVLTTLFDVKSTVEPLQGCWLPLECDDYSRIGMTGQNQLLGQNSVLGKRVWEQTAGVKVSMGPMGATQFYDLLPTSECGNFNKLVGATDFYLHEMVNSRVELVVNKDDVEPQELGKQIRLGWTSWLKARDQDDYQNRVGVSQVSIKSLPHS